MASHEALLRFFDYEHPTPTQILKSKKNIIDLTKYSSIRDEDVFDAIFSSKSTQAVILPNDYERKLLEVRNHSLDVYDSRTQHFLHWRYAPDIVLNTTEMGVEDTQQKKFTLREAARSKSWDYHIPHRGFGVVDVRTHEYTLWPFLYLLEGIKTQDIVPRLITTKSSEGHDVVGSSPSLKEEKMYTVTVKNVPFISTREPYVLGTQLHAKCDCLWSHYGARRVYERRYVGGERVMCNHSIAFYKHLLDEFPGEILDVLPRLTGIMNPWYTLKERTIVDGQKLTVTRMNSLLGMLIAYMGAWKALG